MANLGGVLFDGIAYGSLLFLISLGLSVTLGLMNFINLAHGAFAMIGGYVCVTLMSRAGVPFLATLPLSFIAMAFVGWVTERTLVRRLYAASPLGSSAVLDWRNLRRDRRCDLFLGHRPAAHPVARLSSWRMARRGMSISSVYRLFLIGLVDRHNRGPCFAAGPHPLWRHNPRRRRQRRRRARPGHQCRCRVQRDLRLGRRAGRPRRRVEHRHPESYAQLRPELHNLFPLGGDRRRPGKYYGDIDRGDGARHF